MAFAIRFAHQFEQMMIVDRLDLIGKHHKEAINFIELAAVKMITKLFATQTQCMPPGMFAQHQLRIRHADRLRGHDFVGQAIFKHAILMDAGFVRERIAPDDGFVRLHRNAGNFFQQLAGRDTTLRWRCWSGTDSDQPRTRSAITISSSEALPARSPMPLIVHST